MVSQVGVCAPPPFFLHSNNPIQSSPPPHLLESYEFSLFAQYADSTQLMNVLGPVDVYVRGIRLDLFDVLFTQSLVLFMINSLGSAPFPTHQFNQVERYVLESFIYPKTLKNIYNKIN